MVTLSCFYLSPLSARAEGLIGNWISQDHSVIRIYECDAHSLCARVIKTNDPQAIDRRLESERDTQGTESMRTAAGTRLRAGWR